MRKIGTANAWFSFKGTSCATMGIFMTGMPIRPHPAANGELKSVPGRDGKLWIPDGAYDRVLVQQPCETGDDASFDAIGKWLTGTGDLIFGDEPTRAYRATVTKEFALNNPNGRMINRAFTVTFDCEPYKYETPTPSDITITASGQTITNSGCASLPVIKLTGSGDITLTINTQQIDIDGMSGTLIIDSAMMECFNGDRSELRNSIVTMDDFPTLPSGAVIVSYTGNVTQLKISPNWRYL